MWTRGVILIALFSSVTSEDSNEDAVLYYYGLEESERTLPVCAARQACAAVLRRYWRPPALLRLCRCAPRRRCDALLPADHRVELNNRAHFQFCQPTTDWPMCTIEDIPLTVESAYDRIDPNEIKALHDQNIQLTPPKIILKCQCRQSKYWKANSTTEGDDIQGYKCVSLPFCYTGEFCGNVSGDLYALYQSCLCPKRNICVHGGGLPQVDITELLYRGKGWRAYCVRVGEEDSYEDY